MSYLLAADAQKRLDETPALSPADRYNIQRQIDAARALDRQRGTEILLREEARLSGDYESITTEARELDAAFTELAKIARRPDSDPREVSRVYAELDGRARVLRKRVQSFAPAVAEHDEQAQDPEGFYAARMAKWAGMDGLNGPQTFLHHIKGL